MQSPVFKSGRKVDETHMSLKTVVMTNKSAPQLGEGLSVGRWTDAKVCKAIRVYESSSIVVRD